MGHDFFRTARSYGFCLRNSLAQQDVVVHVFHEFNAALTLMQRKKIDTVVLEFDNNPETTNFCNQATASKIPIVFASGGGGSRPPTIRL